MKNLIQTHTKFLGFLLFVLTCHVFFSTSIFAQTTATSAADQAFEQKVKDLQKDIASKAANIKLEVTSKIQNKAFLGQVTSADSKQIVIDTVKGKRNITVNEYTDYKLADNANTQKTSPSTLKAITPTDYIVALGDLDDQNRLVAKRVIKVRKITPVNSYTFWGQIQLFSDSVIRILTHDNQIQRITLTGNTVIKNSAGDATLADLKIGKKIIAVSESSQSAVASFIYIPNEATQASQIKSASPSATPKTNSTKK